MYQRKSKKWLTVRVVASYLVMTIAIAIILTVTVLLTLGYRFDHDGRVSQGGLVQFGSTPGGASIQVDGQKTGLTTTNQKTLAAGAHEFSYAREGYREWKKSLDLKAGNILWLNYARLVPNQLTPQTVATYDSLSSASASPDSTRIVLVPNAEEPKVTIETIKSDKIKTTKFTLPEGSYTSDEINKKHDFSIEKWSNDSRYILLKHTYGVNSVEWLRVDTSQLDSNNAEAVINITTSLSLGLESVEFDPQNGSRLYALTSSDNDLRRINLDDTTISAPLAQNIARYSVASDGMITYATNFEKDTKKRSIGYVSAGSTKNQTLRIFNDDRDDALFVASGTYYSQRYVAVADSEKLMVFEADLPDSGSTNSTLSMKSIATEKLPFAPLDVSINTRGRFVTAQFADRYAVYDNELSTFTMTRLTKQPVSANTSHVDRDHWLDGYILYNDSDGLVTIRDFDGKNTQTIMTTAGYATTLSPNGKYLYSFQKDNDGKIALSRVQMILD